MPSWILLSQSLLYARDSVTPFSTSRHSSTASHRYTRLVLSMRMHHLGDLGLAELPARAQALQQRTHKGGAGGVRGGGRGEGEWVEEGGLKGDGWVVCWCVGDPDTTPKPSIDRAMPTATQHKAKTHSPAPRPPKRQRRRRRSPCCCSGAPAATPGTPLPRPRAAAPLCPSWPPWPPPVWVVRLGGRLVVR